MMRSNDPAVMNSNAPMKSIQIKSMEDYKKVYEYSLKHSDEFWDQVARTQIEWSKPWSRVQDCDYHTGRVSWFVGAELNVTHNCLDRHILAGHGDRRALIWIGNEPGQTRTFTFSQLHQQVCRASSALEKLGIKKGDRVVCYMPNVPELAITVLACARIGAIHSVIFGGFSSQSIANRVTDCRAKLIVTADGTMRGDKWIPLKDKVLQALELGCPSVTHIITVKSAPDDLAAGESKNQAQTKTDAPSQDQPVQPHASSVTESSWAELIASGLDQHTAQAHSAQDPLFILYTSGSTGKPKGVLHKMGGYLTYASYTHQIVFRPNPETDVYWCTADMGWITGHTYLLYGPLSNGVTTVMFEGVPTYPTPGRFWQEIDRHQVSIFYTAPTAIRTLAACSPEHVDSCKLTSLKTLGTVGEPINPEAWNWYNEKVGRKNAPIVDTWWQTETGGILISALAGISPTRAGSASFPLPGIEPKLLDEDGKELTGSEQHQGALVLARSWPGQMTEVYGEPDRFFQTYFTQYPGHYFSGDAAMRDQDGFYWIKGRTDDVIKISGHRLGTAEIESACILADEVAESAAVGTPDPVTGEALTVFVVTKTAGTDLLRKKLVELVRKEVGPLASPKQILFVPGLPKTRSGKIMRRILKKLAIGDYEQLGDLSTLSDPSIVQTISDHLQQENEKKGTKKE